MFSHSLTILRVRGIPIRLHWSLLLLLPFLVFAGTYQFERVVAWLSFGEARVGGASLGWGLVLAVGLLVSVVIHELAHALVGIRSGTRIRSITLMLLGGVTRMERTGPPEREASMALAGPLASFAVAVLAFLVYRFVPLRIDPRAAVLVLSATNALLGGFNLLPAFPMDGGRVLRGLLARRMRIGQATHIAAQVGRFMAVLFGLWAVWSFNLLLGLIAIFVYMGANAEEQHWLTREVLEGMTVRQLMTEHLADASPDDTAAEVARRLLANHAMAARIVTNGTASPGHVAGIVTAWDLAAAEDAPATPVAALVRRDLPSVHPDADATTALDVLGAGSAMTAMVVDENQDVVGMVTTEDIAHAILLRGIEHARKVDRGVAVP